MQTNNKQKPQDHWIRWQDAYIDIRRITDEIKWKYIMQTNKYGMYMDIAKTINVSLIKWSIHLQLDRSTAC